MIQRIFTQQLEQTVLPRGLFLSFPFSAVSSTLLRQNRSLHTNTRSHKKSFRRCNNLLTLPPQLPETKPAYRDFKKNILSEIKYQPPRSVFEIKAFQKAQRVSLFSDQFNSVLASTAELELKNAGFSCEHDKAVFDTVRQAKNHPLSLATAYIMLNPTGLLSGSCNQFIMQTLQTHRKPIEIAAGTMILKKIGYDIAHPVWNSLLKHQMPLEYALGLAMLAHLHLPSDIDSWFVKALQSHEKTDALATALWGIYHSHTPQIRDACPSMPKNYHPTVPLMYQLCFYNPDPEFISIFLDSCYKTVLETYQFNANAFLPAAAIDTFFMTYLKLHEMPEKLITERATYQVAVENLRCQLDNWPTKKIGTSEHTRLRYIGERLGVDAEKAPGVLKTPDRGLY